MIETSQQCEVQQLAKNDLGTFEVVSGALRISDPSYDLSMGFAGTVKNVTKGTWRATSCTRRLEKPWGDRVGELEAVLEGSQRDLSYKECRFIVGVDSATAGIFDLSHFRDDSVVTPETPISQLWMKYLEQKRDWEGMCHTAAYGELSPRTWTFVPGGVVPFGVVSASGCGDGGYPAYVKRNSKGEAVAVRIVFIGEDEE